MKNDGSYFNIGNEFDRLVGNTYGGGQKTWEDYDKIALGCVRCQELTSVRCENCGFSKWEFARGRADRIGIACKRCDVGFSDWACESCGTDNPVNGYTLFLKKAGPCFVATAAFGDYAADEVVYLSSFRDTVLRRSHLGRRFVVFYYQVGPTLAHFIEDSPGLRVLTRKLFLIPLVNILKRFNKI